LKCYSQKAFQFEHFEIMIIKRLVSSLTYVPNIYLNHRSL
jgi:hypothetical protein